MPNILNLTNQALEYTFKYHLQKVRISFPLKHEQCNYVSMQHDCEFRVPKINGYKYVAFLFPFFSPPESSIVGSIHDQKKRK